MTTPPQPDRTDAPLTFEAALTQLETLVGELEDGQLGLDESVARFRQATELAGYCKHLIANARLRVTELQEQPAPAPDDEAGDSAPLSLRLFDGDSDDVAF